MRRQLTFCMFVGVVAAALSTGLHRELRSQDPGEEKNADAGQSIKQQEFEGVSDRRSYEEALADALKQMDQAVAEQGRYPCTKVKWRVLEIGGTSGSPAGLNEMRVKITASFEAKDPEPLGTWKVTRRASDDEIEGFTLTIKREGKKLIGTVNWADGKTETSPIKLKDNNFTIRLKPGSVIHQYGGKLSGDTIKGKWAAGIAVFDWEAKRTTNGKTSD
jgi:hypothetical protein